MQETTEKSNGSVSEMIVSYGQKGVQEVFKAHSRTLFLRNRIICGRLKQILRKNG
jgi:hypothetical protein